MSGQVVVVTGASGGIGWATTVAFARRGDQVALLGRGEKGLPAATAEVRAAGGPRWSGRSTSPTPLTKS